MPTLIGPCRRDITRRDVDKLKKCWPLWGCACSLILAMHLHTLPHHGNLSLIGMFLGVAVIPTGLLAILFLIAHSV